MEASDGIAPVFDDVNLVSHAGLVTVLGLAERAGLTELIEDASTLESVNVAVKVLTVIGGMLAGADSIDDLDVLRSGATARVFGDVRAPPTIGTFRRSFTHGHILQLRKVNRVLQRRLIGEVHRYQKQAAAFGYSGVRGLNALSSRSPDRTPRR